MSIHDETITGVAWTVAVGGGRQLLQLVLLVVLARLLTPADFGLVGMITVVTALLMLILDAGLADALVQRPDLGECDVAAAFWLIVATGCGLGAATAAAAPLIGRLYGEPRLVPLVAVAALQLVARAAGVVPLALLRRRMSFRAVALIDLAALAGGGAVAVVLAARGHGPWSLIWQQVTAPSIAALAGLAVAALPLARIRGARLRPLLDFGIPELGFRTVNYASRHADDLLVGRHVGAAGLGVYGRAYALMLIPLRQVTQLLGQVMLPAMARFGADRPRVRRVYLRAAGIVGLVTMPMAAGLFVVADDFVAVVFGPRWAAVAPVLRVLCLVAVQQPVAGTSGWIFLALGRTDIRFRWGVVTGLVTVAAFAIGIRWGVMGVAVAYTIRSWLLLVPAITIPGRLIGLRFGEFARGQLGAAGCALLMAIAVAGADRLFALDAHGALVALAVDVATGVGLYALAVHLTSIAAYRDARALLAEIGRGRGAPDHVAAS